ncbi:MAG: NPXTG-anchored protein, partial [Clostridiales bacterium]|nr:NPXTG-anchored protein [Clostridiales bacterium]
QDGYRVTLPDNTVLYFASEEEMSEALGLMLTNGLLTADEYDAVLLTAEAYEVPVESETTTEAENEEDDETTTTEDEEETTTALDTQKLGTSVSNPKTGDASAAMWIVMAGAAVCAMVLLRRKPVAE